MSHPHAAVLKEFELAIKKISPTLPDLAVAAKKMLADLRADENITEEGVMEALAEVGRKEYPHRHALQDIHAKYGEGMEARMVLEHLDPAVAKKLEPMLKHGVTVEEAFNSDWFEEKLTPEERYQVEDGMLLARYKLEQEDKGLVQTHTKDFEERVAYWETEAKKIEALIDMLESLAGKDARYKDEINSQVRMFREGFSVTERDPNPTDVQAAIDYWTEVLNPDDSV